MGSFYPHGKPGYYAYTRYFLDVGNDTVGKAIANTKYPGLGSFGHSITIKALINLKEIMNAARAAELAFLRDTGINLDNPNASNIFRSINKVLNSKDTFERGLQYMKKLSKIGRVKDEKTHTYRDVSSFFETYLNQVLKEQDLRKIIHMSPDQIKNQINIIIGEALTRTYTRVKDYIDEEGNRRLMTGNSHKGKAAPNTATNEQEIAAITDMLSAIEELQKSGAFSQFGYLFNIGEKDLEERIRTLKGKKKKGSKSKKNLKKYNDAKVQANFQGNILELISTTVAAQIGNIHVANQGLTITGVHTGQMNQMKADSMLLVGNGPVDIEKYFGDYNANAKEKGYDSVRMQNIDALGKFLDKLEDNIKHVIMISDKNYSIKANFGGINTQEKMNIGQAAGMLGSMGVGDTAQLLNYLANCGDQMVQGNVDGEIRTELQTLIGYFLFDHLQIDFTGSRPGPNVVNLLNVSGMYIPLSTYLEGLYDSIQNAAANPSSFVSVSISLGGETEGAVWDASSWGAFRQSHETQSFISYRILKGIADFISGL